jgi:mRNA interferase RelE/StbE
MAVYKVYFKHSADKDLKPIPDTDLKKILKRIESLAKNPRPMGCEKVVGQDKYRVRQGDYRILYTINDDALIVRIMKVGHRKDIYRISEEKSRYVAKRT